MDVSLNEVRLISKFELALISEKVANNEQHSARILVFIAYQGSMFRSRWQMSDRWNASQQVYSTLFVYPDMDSDRANIIAEQHNADCTCDRRLS